MELIESVIKVLGAFLTFGRGTIVVVLIVIGTMVAQKACSPTPAPQAARADR